MKIKFAIALAAGLLLSCSPKLAQTTQPPATPEPPAVAETPAASIATVPMGPMVVTAASPDDIAKGKELFLNTCANCHNLYPATAHTREDWTPILLRMQKHANITDADLASITTYIHSEL